MKTNNMKPTGYWTKERCHDVASKCKSRSEFRKKYGSAYQKSSINNWIDSICKHMKEIKKPKGYWTKERCQEVALKCENRLEFSKKYSSAYHIVCKNKWLDSICKHMKEIKKYRGYWTKERCQEVALKCKSRSEFQIKYNSVYNKSRISGWLNSICKHMK